jgi:hypothetical protein
MSRPVVVTTTMLPTPTLTYLIILRKMLRRSNVTVRLSIFDSIAASIMDNLLTPMRYHILVLTKHCLVALPPILPQKHVVT